jgi:hypothetical protein
VQGTLGAVKKGPSRVQSSKTAFGHSFEAVKKVGKSRAFTGRGGAFKRVVLLGCIKMSAVA